DKVSTLVSLCRWGLQPRRRPSIAPIPFRFPHSHVPMSAKKKNFVRRSPFSSKVSRFVGPSSYSTLAKERNCFSDGVASGSVGPVGCLSVPSNSPIASFASIKPIPLPPDLFPPKVIPSVLGACSFLSSSLLLSLYSTATAAVVGVHLISGHHRFAPACKCFASIYCSCIFSRCPCCRCYSNQKLCFIIQVFRELKEMGSPTEHTSGAPFVLIPDENIRQLKKSSRISFMQSFTHDVPPMGRIIGILNAIWAKSGPRIFVHNLGQGSFLLKLSIGCSYVCPLHGPLTLRPKKLLFLLLWFKFEMRNVPYLLLFNDESLSRFEGFGCYGLILGEVVSLWPDFLGSDGIVLSEVAHGPERSFVTLFQELFLLMFIVLKPRSYTCYSPGVEVFWKFCRAQLGRIVIVWDPRITASAQSVTCGIHVPAENLNITVSFVYGSGFSLDGVSRFARHNAAVFLVVLGQCSGLQSDPEIRASFHHLSARVDISGIEDTNLSLQEAELFEAQAKGLPFTWRNNQDNNPISTKIDHAFINHLWASSFPDSYADFLDPDQSDHAPCLFRLPSHTRRVCKPFKFFHHSLTILSTRSWQFDHIVGTNQFKLVRSLKLLKGRHYNGISRRQVKEQSAVVDNLQRSLLTASLFRSGNCKGGACSAAQLNILLNAEHRFYRQRSRVRWADVRERNTTF
ncbi:hypothetical protein HID58_077892, partial [Brassica napus]